METVEPKKTYIGDGVYAWFDGWNIWLETTRDGILHTIAIEQAVFEELYRYGHSVGFQLKDLTNGS